MVKFRQASLYMKSLAHNHTIGYSLSFENKFKSTATFNFLKAFFKESFLSRQKWKNCYTVNIFHQFCFHHSIRLSIKENNYISLCGKKELLGCFYLFTIFSKLVKQNMTWISYIRFRSIFFVVSERWLFALLIFVELLTITV